MIRAFFCVCFWLFFNAFGQSKSTFSPINDSNKLVEKLISANKKISTIRAKFEQENKSSLLQNIAISKGELWFKSGNRFLLKYDGKEADALIFNDGYLLKKEGKKIQKLSINSSKTVKQIYQLIIGSMNGEIMKDVNFTIQYFNNSTHYLLVLTPINKQLKKGIEKIEILLKKESLFVQSFKMTEPSSDYSKYSFSDVEYNSFVSDSLFLLNTK